MFLPRYRPCPGHHIRGERRVLVKVVRWLRWKPVHPNAAVQGARGLAAGPLVTSWPLAGARRRSVLVDGENGHNYAVTFPDHESIEGAARDRVPAPRPARVELLTVNPPPRAISKQFG